MEQDPSSKPPVTSDDAEQARRWLEVWPHAVGAALFVTALVTLIATETTTRISIVVLGAICIVYLAMSVICSQDVVKAWERGEGRWFRRARPDEDPDDL